jgi:hypothetical protein
MSDLIVLLLILGFFMLLWGMVILFEGLKES